MDKPATTAQPIHPLLANRWSPRAFAADYVIDEPTQTALLEAARWSPSCFGAEPWRFIVANKHSQPQRWEQALACLVEGNRAWAKNSSLLIFVCAQTHFEANGKPNRHHAYDSGAAAMALVLQAEHLGLRAHQMGGFSPDAVRAAFGVPDSLACLAGIAIGKQAAAETLPAELAERERAPHQRKPLSEIIL